MLFVVVSILLIGSFVGRASVPAPGILPMMVCFDLECVKGVVEIAQRDEIVLASTMTYDVALDGYLALYTGWLMHMCDNLPFNIYFLLYQKPESEHIHKAAFSFMQSLPRLSIFFLFEHGLSSFGLKNLQIAMESGNVGPFILFHINHEQPWMNIPDVKSTSWDALYPSTKHIVEAYRAHPAVFRNYYFDPLVEVSEYFPVGTSFYGYVIGNTSSTIYNSRTTRASKRKHFCYFTGRLLYPHRISHEHAREREQLWRLYMQGPEADSHGCTLATSDRMDLDFHTLTYEEYAEVMVDTVFALCPAGNNPETFRHYEVSEKMNA